MNARGEKDIKTNYTLHINHKNLEFGRKHVQTPFA